MPEMPELEVLRGFLAPRLRERRISDVSISPRFGFLLRTPVDELRARAIIEDTIEEPVPQHVHS